MSWRVSSGMKVRWKYTNTPFDTQIHYCIYTCYYVHFVFKARNSLFRFFLFKFIITFFVFTSKIIKYIDNGNGIGGRVYVHLLKSPYRHFLPTRDKQVLHFIHQVPGIPASKTQLHYINREHYVLKHCGERNGI